MDDRDKWDTYQKIEKVREQRNEATRKIGCAIGSRVWIALGLCCYFLRTPRACSRISNQVRFFSTTYHFPSSHGVLASFPPLTSKTSDILSHSHLPRDPYKSKRVHLRQWYPLYQTDWLITLIFSNKPNTALSIFVYENYPRLSSSNVVHWSHMVHVLVANLKLEILVYGIVCGHLDGRGLFARSKVSAFPEASSTSIARTVLSRTRKPLGVSDRPHSGRSRDELACSFYTLFTRPCVLPQGTTTSRNVAKPRTPGNVINSIEEGIPPTVLPEHLLSFFLCFSLRFAIHSIFAKALWSSRPANLAHKA